MSRIDFLFGPPPCVVFDRGRPGGDCSAAVVARRITGQRADWIIIDDIHVADDHVAARENFSTWYMEKQKMCEQSDCKCPAPNQPGPNEFEDRQLTTARPFGLVTQLVKTWTPSYSRTYPSKRYLNTSMRSFTSRKDALDYAKAKSAQFPGVPFMLVTLTDVLATVPPPARLRHTKVRARK